MQPRANLAAPILALLTLVACPEPEQVCVPGVTQLCVCPGSLTGAQFCREGGDGWSTCDCAHSTDAALAPDAAEGHDTRRDDAALGADRTGGFDSSGPDVATPPDAMPADAASPPDTSTTDTGVHVDAGVTDATTPDATAGLDATGEDSSSTDVALATDGSVAVDAVASADAALPTCTSPFDNTCGQGNKCTFIGDGVSPTQTHVGCAPVGEVAEDQPCSFDALGVDDCQAGLFCARGTCTEICSRVLDSCPAEHFCEARSLIDDTDIGTCEPFCNVILNDCPAGQGCYFNDVLEAGLCYAPGDQAGGYGCGAVTLPPGTQDACCSFLNSCAIGYGCIGLLPDLSGRACAAYCDPSNTIGSSDCTPTAGSDYYCLDLDKFYGGMQPQPEYLGMCISETTWGPATCFNDTQDAEEDGMDCCLTSGGSCPCALPCD